MNSKFHIYNFFIMKTHNFWILIYFIIRNVQCEKFCDIEFTNNECINVYDYVWKFQNSKTNYSINLCQNHLKNCDSKAVIPEILGTIYSPKNSTFKVSFHCRVQKTMAVYFTQDNIPVYEIPSTSCAKDCIFDIKNIPSLRINLSRIADLHTVTNKDEYRLNICRLEHANPCNGSFCISHKNDNDYEVLSKNITWDVVYYPNKGLDLTHFSASSNIHIYLSCDPSANLNFTLENQSSKNYYFNAISSEFCIKLPGMELARMDYQQLAYSLYSLKFQTIEFEFGVFYLNFDEDGLDNHTLCHSKDRLVFACVCPTNDFKDCKSLGTVVNGVKIHENVNIVLSKGDLCSNLANQANLRVEFECSDHEGHLEFRSVDNNCTYTLLLKTPLACQKVTKTSMDCAINDNHFSTNRFSFTSLENDVEVPTEIGDVILNLCKPINKKCAGKASSRLCLIRNNTEIPFGSNELHYSDGRFDYEFVSNEPSCLGSFFYKVTIHMVCSYAVLSQIQPTSKMVLFPPKTVNKKHTCNVYMEWITHLACAESKKSLPCKVPGTGYDLSPLIKFDKNYQIWGNNLVYVINICKSVIFGENAFFKSPDPGVLMVNMSEPNFDKKTKVLGKVSSPEYDLATKSIVIRQKNNFPKSQSTLFFECSKDYEPVFKIRSIAENSYNFTVLTVHACPKEQDLFAPSHKSLENGEIVTESQIATTPQTTKITKRLKTPDDIKLPEVSSILPPTIREVPKITPIKTKDNPIQVIETPPARITSNIVECSTIYLSNKTLFKFDYFKDLNISKPYFLSPVMNYDEISHNFRNICKNLTSQYLSSCGTAEKHSISEHLIDECCDSSEKSCAKLIINLSCDYLLPGIGKPSPLDTAHVSHWKSSIFCPTAVGLYDERKQILTNPYLLRKLDLSMLTVSNSVEIKMDSRILLVDFSLPKHEVVIDFSNNLVNLSFFLENPACKQGFKSISFNMICNHRTAFSVHEDTECSVEFKWNLQEICYLIGLEDTLNYTSKLTIVPKQLDDKTEHSPATNSGFYYILILPILIFVIIFIINSRYYLIYGIDRCIPRRYLRRRTYSNLSEILFDERSL